MLGTGFVLLFAVWKIKKTILRQPEHRHLNKKAFYAHLVSMGLLNFVDIIWSIMWTIGIKFKDKNDKLE